MPQSAEVVFEVLVGEGSVGSVAVSYLRSRSYNLGKARCSVGGQEAVLDGNWSRSISIAQTTVIATNLPAGTYEVTCRTLSPEPGTEQLAFRLMGIMSV